jgi:hypothetical protein
MTNQSALSLSLSLCVFGDDGGGGAAAAECCTLILPFPFLEMWPALVCNLKKQQQREMHFSPVKNVGLDRKFGAWPKFKQIPLCITWSFRFFAIIICAHSGVVEGDSLVDVR